MKTKAKSSKYMREAFKQALERVSRKKDVSLLALFCVGFKTGYNYRKTEKRD